MFQTQEHGFYMLMLTYKCTSRVHQSAANSRQATEKHMKLENVRPTC